jgi:NAD(P)-dependent dehydrogenase (short-subunit alcohol dehydrogenase family)
VDEGQGLFEGWTQVSKMRVISEVIVLIGAGSIGQAIARRQGFGKIVLLADANEQVLAEAAASLKHASHNVESQLVDVTSKPSVRALADKAPALGNVCLRHQHRGALAQHGIGAEEIRGGPLRHRACL